MSMTLAKLAECLGAELIGDSNQVITGLAPIQSATPHEVSFINNPKYLKYLASANAGAILVDKHVAHLVRGNKLLVADAYVAYAQASALFAHVPRLPEGIHPSAVVAASATISAHAAIGPMVVIGEHAVIGERCQIHAGTIIGDGVHIGEDSCIWSRVSIYYRVRIGKRAVIHSGAVIGSDGFGMANDQGRWVKIYQLGSVILGDDVEVGAQTAIDRGALGDTIIGNGVKLDNLIQIGHNVQIGDYTAIAGTTGIAGSTVIGKHCMISGGVSINGHIRIVDGVVITGNSAVHKDIMTPGVYSSGTFAVPYQKWRRNVARFNRLDEMAKRVRHLEQLCEVLHEDIS